MKAAIIYDSRTNTTKKAADFIAEGLKKAGDIEVRCFNIDNVDFAYVTDVDMAIYSMVKNNTFNGIGLPDIVLRHENGECEVLKHSGYEDFKGRLS